MLLTAGSERLQIALHDHTEVPEMIDSGFDVSPGGRSKVTIKRTEVSFSQIHFQISAQNNEWKEFPVLGRL